MKRKDNPEGLETNPKRVRRAVRDIFYGFDWSKTEEGEPYWSIVIGKLAGIAQDESAKKKVKKPNKQTLPALGPANETYISSEGA
jgi:hypothetical protein